MNKDNIKAFFIEHFKHFNDELFDNDLHDIKNLLMYASFSMVLDDEAIQR